MHTALSILWVATTLASAATAELKNVSISGGLEEGKARLVIEAALNGLSSEKEKLLYATTLNQSIQITRERLTNVIDAKFEILEGHPVEISLTLAGQGEIRRVTGASVQDWSVRQETNGT